MLTQYYLNVLVAHFSFDKARKVVKNVTCSNDVCLISSVRKCMYLNDHINTK